MFTLRWLLWLLWATSGLASGGSVQTRLENRPMRILALFSGTRNELGLDHRLGRQILRLALARAKQLHPSLKEVELVVHNDDTECSSLNELPVRVAEQFYGNEQQQQQQQQCSTESTSGCDATNAKSSGTNQQQQTTLDAIIGPSCDHLVDLVGRMAAYWRTPMYSVASVGAAFGHKEIYSTLTRLSPAMDQLSAFVAKTMERFRWRHLAILVDRARVENRILLDNLERTFNQLRYSIATERKLIDLAADKMLGEEATEGATEGPTTLCSAEARRSLLEARRVARVFLLLVSDHLLVRRMLLCAHELHMSNGEFVFLAIDTGLKSVQALEAKDDQQADLEGKPGAQARSSKSTSLRAVQSLDWYAANDEQNNVIARRVFESLMVISVELPISDEFNLFVEQTLEMAQKEFPAVRFERANVGSLAVALHDSLLLAVEAHLRQQQQSGSNASRARFSSKGGASSGDEDHEEADEERLEEWRPSLEAALMWNERYSGGLIANMHINQEGDQELDYILNDLEPEMGVMRPVARFAKESRLIEPLPGTFIHWPARAGALSGERPPLDEPECGFNGDAERCIDRQNLYAALSIVLGLALAVLASAAVSLRKYRKIKYQMQLDDYWWKIQWDEVQFIQTTDSLVSSSPQSVARALKAGGSVVSSQGSGCTMVSLAKASKQGEGPTTRRTGDKPAGPEVSKRRRTAVPTIVTSTIDQIEAAQSVAGSGTGSGAARSGFAASQAGSNPSAFNIRSEHSSVVRASSLAMYRNELVIIKCLNGSAVEVSRDLLVDLRSMREHIHDNLAKFVGLSVEPERLAIVYEYCSRGSLQDMLLNESIAIDWTLTCSIIGDILNGLHFIHTTLLDYHGRLKSTNLVLDSRFTVKITDFGLQNLYSQLEAIEDVDDDDDGEGGGSDDYGLMVGANENQQRDTLSLSVSQRAVGGPNPRHKSSRSGREGKRLKLKNKSSARYFWTAPEHLRAKEVHHSGSKKGDVYSLAVIFFELLTRREPYHYGTNAKPHWPTIKRERHESHQGQQLSRGSISGFGARGSQLSAGSSLGHRAQSKLRRLSASKVGPQKDPVETTSIVSVQSGHSIVSAKDNNNNEQSTPHKIQVQHQRHQRQQRAARLSVAAINEEEVAGDDPASVLPPEVAPEEPIDAEEILDQLRMGLQPEPVRPHLPNFVLQEVNPKLVELMRDCWSEQPEARPSLAQIRTQMRRLTKGMASRNYLDNLLERLQNYAADLERIVDAKSGDIVEEKYRTEELLYQLVPKFVAESLKRNEPIIPQVFDGVTIFFSDIVGFEKYASVLSPSDLVDLLNSIYASFESVITSFDVTKIETIIDQLLIASGINWEHHNQHPGAPLAGQQSNNLSIEQAPKEPVTDQSVAATVKAKRNRLLGSLRHSRGSSENRNQSLENPNSFMSQDQSQVSQADSLLDQLHYRRSSAEQIARMALCLRDQMKSFHFRASSQQGHETATGPSSGLVVANFNIRMGIHSGKVCAGIVGVKRPKFCLIGDTVNVASRMHTNSKANKIQISTDTKELLSQVAGLAIEARGKIEVKGKGMMETFWLESSF